VHVRAAEYWLALGKFDEASEELERIQLSRRNHPTVTHLQLRIQQAAQAMRESQDASGNDGLVRRAS
jgi:hypothetical protein